MTENKQSRWDIGTKKRVLFSALVVVMGAGLVTGLSMIPTSAGASSVQDEPVTMNTAVDDVGWSTSDTVKVYDIQYSRERGHATSNVQTVGEDVIDTNNYATDNSGGWKRLDEYSIQGGFYHSNYIDSVSTRYQFYFPEDTPAEIDVCSGPTGGDVDDTIEIRYGLWNEDTNGMVQGDGLWWEDYSGTAEWSCVDLDGGHRTFKIGTTMATDKINDPDTSFAIDARVLGDDDPGIVGDNDNDDGAVGYTYTTYVSGTNTEEAYSFEISDHQAQSLKDQATLSFDFDGVASQQGAGDGKQMTIRINGNEIFAEFDSYAGGKRTIDFSSSYLQAGENTVTVSGPSLSGDGAYGFTISDIAVSAPTNGDYDGDGLSNWNDPYPRDVDGDDDGVDDPTDECPSTPGDNDGYKDNGCPENPAPSVSLDGTQAEEGNSVTLTADATDPEGESLTYDWSLSGVGALSGSGASVSYTAPAGISSDSSATIFVTVSEQDESKPAQDSATVSVQNDPSNNDPDEDGIPNSDDECDNTAEDFDGYEDSDGCPENPAPSVSLGDTKVSEGNSATMTADAYDPEGESLTYDWSLSDEGTLSGSGESVTYTAPADISSTTSATVSLTVFEQDAEKPAQTSATVDIESTESENLDPIASNVSVSITESTLVSSPFDASDPDGDSLSYSVVTAPDHGNVSVNGDSFTYEPDTGYSGSDSFRYAVADGNGGTDTATVAIKIEPVESPGLISGTVINADNTPLSGATVTIEDASDSSVAETTTGSEGQYSVEVPPGEYTVVAEYNDQTGVKSGAVVESLAMTTIDVVISDQGLSQNLSASRHLSSTQTTPGSEVPVTVEATAQSSALTINETFSPAVGNISITSVTVDGNPRTPIVKAAESQGAVVTMNGLEPGQTVTVRYNITVPENTEIGTSYLIAGTVTSGDEASLDSDQLTVEEDSPLEGIAGDYDNNNDGEISVSELGQAAIDYSTGEVSLTELAQVAAVYSN